MKDVNITLSSTLVLKFTLFYLKQIKVYAITHLTSFFKFVLLKFC